VEERKREREREREKEREKERKRKREKEKKRKRQKELCGYVYHIWALVCVCVLGIWLYCVIMVCVFVCGMMNWDVRHDAFILVAWLIHTCCSLHWMYMVYVHTSEKKRQSFVCCPIPSCMLFRAHALSLTTTTESNFTHSRSFKNFIINNSSFDLQIKKMPAKVLSLLYMCCSSNQGYVCTYCITIICNVYHENKHLVIADEIV